MNFVWIVAVERYGTGPEGKPGAVPAPPSIGVQALELAAACAVRDPTAKIVLSVSLPDTAAYKRLRDELPAAIKVMDATQSALQDALIELRGTGTLLTYWVGHGIMANDRRLLVTADSEGLDDLRAIDVDSILRHLRTQAYPRMQVGFFDACANAFPQPNALMTLGSDGMQPTDQYVYFAASAGQVAPADTSSGGFSGTVIAALTDSQRAFPPEPQGLFADLRRRFEELKLSTRAFPLQWTEGSGDVWSRQGGTQDEALIRHARAAWCSVGEFEHLRTPVDGCVDDDALSGAVRHETVDTLLSTLRETCPTSRVDLLADAWERLKLARTVEAACLKLGLPWQDWLALQDQVTGMSNLQSAPAPDSLVDLLLTVLAQTRRERGWDALVRLLGLAARRIRLTDAGRADALLDCMREQPSLQPRVEDALASLPQAAGPAFLLIGLVCEGADKRISVAESWVYDVNGESDALWRAPEAAELSTVGQVNALIERAKDRYRDRTLVIELLAPNELLCSPREFLELVDQDLETRVWLEQENVILLRWHNRMKGDTRYRPGTWIRKARETQQKLLGTAALTCAWAGDAPEGQILGIPFPGPSLDVPQRNRGLFFTEMMRGAPYMCWPRTPPGDLAAFKQSVCAFVTTHGTVAAPLAASDRLIRLAEALRCAKQGGTADLRDLWLFVDDPARNPYKTWQYAEPSKETP